MSIQTNRNPQASISIQMAGEFGDGNGGMFFRLRVCPPIDPSGFISIGHALGSRMLVMRKPRMLSEGACYHVTARANRKEMILGTDESKKLLLTVIREAKRRFTFHIDNLCLMGNHVHLIIRPGRKVSLSSIMQWILGVFAMRYNRICRLTGHVWGERFFSRIIGSMRAYRGHYAYIDTNPCAAGLTARQEDWLYGRFHLHSIGFGDILTGPG
jgi:putative transposase